MSAITAQPGLDWHGESVSIADVLDALNRVRHAFAHAEAGDEGQPHPRNCVMTLVSVAPNAVEETRAMLVSTAIARQHPSLAIVVRDEPRIRSGRIDASVMVHPVDQQNHPAPCELVILRVQGAAGAHLAALVDPLLVSGVPVYLWWLSTPPFGSAELNDVLHICDALVVDSSRFDRPYASFLSLAEVAMKSHPHMGMGDLQWERLSPWRETAAQFFAPAERRHLLRGVSEIGIDYAGEGRGNRIGAAMLAGWLAAAVGWKLQRAAAGGGGVVSAIYQVEGWRPVQVQFRSVAKSHAAPGEVSALRIAGTSAGQSFSLSIQRDPERGRRPSDTEFSRLHPAGGEDEAGIELAQRRAEQHLEVHEQSRESLHHTNTGDPPDESLPPRPRVLGSERRRADTSDVLLTMINIGDAETLRHVQRLPPEDEASILQRVLFLGARDPVFKRALVAAAELMRAL